MEEDLRKLREWGAQFHLFASQQAGRGLHSRFTSNMDHGQVTW